MKYSLKILAVAAVMLALGNSAWAKLPATVFTDEAKAKAAGKSVNAPTATPPCADPGAFAYTPEAAPAPAAEVKKP
jgi:hypothetical protein